MSLPRAASQPEASPSATESMGFLSRWSRRKLGQLPDDTAGLAPAPVPVALVQPGLADRAQALPAVTGGDVEQLADQAPAQVPDPIDSDPIDPAIDPIDPRTGKPMSELTDEDMPDIDSLTADSDLRGFMSGKVSQALRTKALNKVFHSAKYNKFCICAEYADDYTNFLPMGDIVPHDLKSAIAREAGKLVKRLAEQGLEMSPEQAQVHMASEFRGEKPALPTLPRVAADGASHGADATAQQAEAELDQRLNAAGQTAQREST